jgi:hypothetical protein
MLERRMETYRISGRGVPQEGWAYKLTKKGLSVAMGLGPDGLNVCDAVPSAAEVR